MTSEEIEVRDVLICDDVRKEENNKLLLVGVYSAGNIILFGEMPVTLPKLFFVVRMKGRKGEHKYRFALKDPDGNTIISPPEICAKIENEDFFFVSSIGISPIKFEKLGPYSFSISLEGKEAPIYVQRFDVSNKKPS